LAVLLLLVCSLPSFAEVTGDNQTQSADALVQKGLTIAEIDRELERLHREEADLDVRIGDTQSKLAEQQKLVAEKREHAGTVLRAYYTGDRDSVWLLLFSLRSFTDLVRTSEYLSMIFDNDLRKLSEYRTAADDLKRLGGELNDAQTKLRQSEADYLAQRDRQIKLQEDLDKQLAGNAEAQAVMTRIAELNSLWQTKGIPLFRTYFGALADAMKGLPELASSKTPDGKSRLSLNGLSASFQLTDADLNDFLRSKNPLFRDLVFRFTKNGVEADGKQDDMTLSLKGVYTLDKEKKVILFHVTNLTFNDYTLPDTTVRDLERQVDLSINPKEFMSFVEPTDIKMDDGKLTVTFKLTL
jgi:hypothetical protein